MEQSEKLSLESEELRATLPEIERKENEATMDPDLCGLVTRLSMAGIIFEVNDGRTKALQEELKARVAVIRTPRREYLKELGRISKELQGLTAEPIRKGVEQFSLFLSLVKLDETKIGEEYKPITKKTLILFLRKLEKQGDGEEKGEDNDATQH